VIDGHYAACWRVSVAWLASRNVIQQVMAPEMDKMASEFEGRAVIAKIDCTSSNPNKRWAMGKQ
jgi:hypothetical protein